MDRDSDVVCHPFSKLLTALTILSYYVLAGSEQFNGYRGRPCRPRVANTNWEDGKVTRPNQTQKKTITTMHVTSTWNIYGGIAIHFAAITIPSGHLLPTKAEARKGRGREREREGD